MVSKNLRRASTQAPGWSPQVFQPPQLILKLSRIRSVLRSTRVLILGRTPTSLKVRSQYMLPQAQHFGINNSRSFGSMSQGGQTLAKIKFPVFSLCYKKFPCVIFMQKLTISSVNKGHIATVL